MLWLLALYGCADYGDGGFVTIDNCIGSFVDPVGDAPDPYEDLAQELTGTYRFDNDLWPRMTLQVRPERLRLNLANPVEGCDYPNLITADGDATASWTPEQGAGTAGVGSAAPSAGIFYASATSTVAGTDPTPFAVWIDESARQWDPDLGALNWFEVTLLWPDQTATLKGYFDPADQPGGTPEDIGPAFIPEFETTFTKIE